MIKYVDKPFFLGADGVKVLRSKFKNANYKYLYYALKMHGFQILVIIVILSG